MKILAIIVLTIGFLIVVGSLFAAIMNYKYKHQEKRLSKELYIKQKLDSVSIKDIEVYLRKKKLNKLNNHGC